MSIINKCLSFVTKFASRLRKNLYTKAGGLATSVVLALILLLREIHLLVPASINQSQNIVERNPYLIDTPACRIANIQADSVEAMKYMFNMDPVDCGKPPLVESNDTHLQIVHSALPKYGIEDIKSLTCCYRPMWRYKPNITIEPGDINASWLYDKKVYENDIRYANTCLPFDDSVEVTVEFVQIECEANKTKIYKDYHGFVPTAKPVESGVKQSTDASNINVVIVGIDSLSRLNMIRKMPKTYDYLTNVLGALPMYGYNKVGINTFPNVVPLLTGYSVKELEFCWANDSAKFDLCPFIWKAFNYRGYATAFIEDTAWMGLFLYLKSGFLHQATQYDARPILYEGEKNIGHNKGLNANYCIGSRTQIQMVVEYLQKLLRRLHHFNQKHFVYSWGTSFSHDNINEPGNADNYYYNLLKNIRDEGLLNDTILLFMSDHGLRFGSFLETDQGRLEGLLPALFMVVPTWFEGRYPEAMENLKINQRRLMTTFDLHQTFNDLMDLRSLVPEYLNTRQMILERSGTGAGLRGISLFLKIPETRNCASAGVPAEFCACRDLDQVSIEAPIVLRAVFLAVGELNAKLRGFPGCVPLVLKAVESASSEKPTWDGGDKTYHVTFLTEPGRGLFYASLSHDIKSDSIKLIGDLSRLNAYGNQSHCVPVSTLRPFCFCVNQND